jgi:hypothetical protein
VTLARTLEPSRNPILEPRTTGEDGASYRVATSPEAHDVKLRRRESAGESLGELRPGLERYIVTKGQFSLIDMIRKILDQTGPADITVSTWTAAGADIAEASDLFNDGRIRSARFLLDHTFQRRKPHFCGQIRKLFGDDAIRITKNHAKLVVIRNDQWNVNVLTSMNLNRNPRMEYLLVRESAELAEFNLEWIDAVFRRRKAGKQFEQTHAHHEHAFEDE